jgi:hypothetical protein
MKHKKSYCRDSNFCDPAGTRTQGPIIKSDVLYQLSYEINLNLLRTLSEIFSLEPGPSRFLIGILYQLSYEINLNLLRTLSKIAFSRTRALPIFNRDTLPTELRDQPKPFQKKMHPKIPPF